MESSFKKDPDLVLRHQIPMYRFDWGHSLFWASKSGRSGKISSAKLSDDVVLWISYIFSKGFLDGCESVGSVSQHRRSSESLSEADSNGSQSFPIPIHSPRFTNP